MSKTIDLSVIVVNYNLTKHIITLIEHLLELNSQVNFDIHIVDNASSDGFEVSIIDKFEPLINENIFIHKNKTNVGFGAAIAD